MVSHALRSLIGSRESDDADGGAHRALLQPRSASTTDSAHHFDASSTSTHTEAFPASTKNVPSKSGFLARTHPPFSRTI